jgi:hypothetical protein
LFAFVPTVKLILIAGRISAITGYFLAFRAAKSTCQINDKAYQQTQAKPVAANDGTAEVIVWLI